MYYLKYIGGGWEVAESHKMADQSSCQTEIWPNAVNQNNFELHTSQSIAKSIANNTGRQSSANSMNCF